MKRLALILLLITMPMSSAGCAFGCNDDRNPSRIRVELPGPLEEGAYDVLLCVDDNCDQFTGINSPGTGATAEASIEIRSDLIVVTPWARQIEAGEHPVELIVSTGDQVVLSFDGVADFVSNGRCYEEDSTATISEESLATP